MMNNREDWTPEERAMQDAIDRVRAEYPDFWSDTPEIPDCMIAEREQLQREAKLRSKKRRRIIAACFAAVCVLSVATAIFLNSDTAHAMKFAMEKKYYQAKGWIQATDPESLNDENVIQVVVTEGEKISQYKTMWEKLLIPDYMPSNYCFEELIIEKSLLGLTAATYQYGEGDNKLIILLQDTTEEDNTKIWTNSQNVLNGQYDYKLWSDKTLDINGIDVIVNDVIVSICGSVSVDELIKILNGLK